MNLNNLITLIIFLLLNVPTFSQSDIENTISVQVENGEYFLLYHSDVINMINGIQPNYNTIYSKTYYILLNYGKWGDESAAELKWEWDMQYLESSNLSQLWGVYNLTKESWNE